MRTGKKFTIERTMSDRRFTPSDIERIESLLATFIAKAIIEGRLTGKESEAEGSAMDDVEDDVLLPEGTRAPARYH